MLAQSNACRQIPVARIGLNRCLTLSGPILEAPSTPFWCAMPVARLLLFVALALGVPGGASAFERVVALPLIFPADSRDDLKISACLRVKENAYPTERAAWESFRAHVEPGPERAFADTLGAMLAKDHDRLRGQLATRLDANPQWFEKQASMFFTQLENLRLGDIWSRYEFDDLVAFFFELRKKNGSFPASFRFVREETGRFGFLPQGSRSLASQFVRTWFFSPWGPVNSRSPAYCSPELLARMTHKTLLQDPDRYAGSATEFLFSGGDPANERFAPLTGAISSLAHALASGRMEEYFDGMTAHGRKWAEGWYVSAEDSERRRFVEHNQRILEAMPVFVIDAEPVFVVYLRVTSSYIEALYFLRQETGRFRWTNAGYATVADSVFKGRHFKDAASEESPFESWKLE